ncbi:uncharacterized protein LOC135844708 [Planococcus citri]|uniref:uncharacterized protein LOC135844708 n=1 Tax=Planococcus citri TaxID=170843 RepID=UPI0031F9CA4D
MAPSLWAKTGFQICIFVSFLLFAILIISTAFLHIYLAIKQDELLMKVNQTEDMQTDSEITSAGDEMLPDLPRTGMQSNFVNTADSDPPAIADGSGSKYEPYGQLPTPFAAKELSSVDRFINNNKKFHSKINSPGQNMVMDPVGSFLKMAKDLNADQNSIEKAAKIIQRLKRSAPISPSFYRNVVKNRKNAAFNRLHRKSYLHSVPILKNAFKNSFVGYPAFYGLWSKGSPSRNLVQNRESLRQSEDDLTGNNNAHPLSMNSILKEMMTLKGSGAKMGKPSENHPFYGGKYRLQFANPLLQEATTNPMSTMQAGNMTMMSMSTMQASDMTTMPMSTMQAGDMTMMSMSTMKPGDTTMMPGDMTTMSTSTTECRLCHSKSDSSEDMGKAGLELPDNDSSKEIIEPRRDSVDNDSSKEIMEPERDGSCDGPDCFDCNDMNICNLHSKFGSKKAARDTLEDLKVPTSKEKHILKQINAIVKRNVGSVNHIQKSEHKQGYMKSNLDLSLFSIFAPRRKMLRNTLQDDGTIDAK